MWLVYPWKDLRREFPTCIVERGKCLRFLIYASGDQCLVYVWRDQCLAYASVNQWIVWPSREKRGLFMLEKTCQQNAQ